MMTGNNQPPRIIIKKQEKPVFYLDTNICIEMAKCLQGKSSSPYQKEIEMVLCVLFDKMKRKQVLCPLGNQLEEMGLTERRINGRAFLYGFTDSQLLSPEEIRQRQFYRGCQAFLKNADQIEFSAEDCFEPSTRMNYRYKVHVGAVLRQDQAEIARDTKKRTVSTLNGMKTGGKRERSYEDQLATELFADAQTFFDVVIKNSEKGVRSLGYIDAISNAYNHMGVAPGSAEQNKEVAVLYEFFLQSNYHHNLPYIQILASTWACRMQRQNSIRDGDELDSLWAAAYLPFVDFAITDKAFSDLLYELKIPERYNVKVYSFPQLGQFLTDISTFSRPNDIVTIGDN